MRFIPSTSHSKCSVINLNKIYFVVAVIVWRGADYRQQSFRGKQVPLEARLQLRLERRLRIVSRQSEFR